MQAGELEAQSLMHWYRTARLLRKFDVGNFFWHERANRQRGCRAEDRPPDLDRPSIRLRLITRRSMPIDSDEPNEPVLASEEACVPDPELMTALDAARARGRLRAAEILADEDILSADNFAKMLGVTQATVNTMRQSGQVLGLDGAKRGFRFPVWQLDGDGKPFTELASLHELLGEPWAVYRFLVQPHGELDGLTGREALERGKGRVPFEVAESIGRTF